ncbi:bifunctional 2-polyprenyl-6-hydroxyphenol methylase/3-demethylubiquinol 3-O-methyltransferase UbiG [Paenibacillus sp. MDMC362]|uniref:class I SAM-dependent methyltransferase n=1 Tax=Paenibacillus sp. MDMC362 TaxID=2977365 RepID=UPI000DC5BF5B|nr:class I SAM-dependent methyltransferase [Paenibacillus sp. MDMC362]RAR44576.1 SAM-dependent methyltransferase [Paenibacillus sp. MDMC362]
MSGYLNVEVPIELLFTDLVTEEGKKDIQNYTDRWYEHHKLSADMPIMRFNSHKSLYRYFMNEQASPSAYLDWYKKIYITRGIEPPLKDEKLIAFRKDQFHMMKADLSSSGDFLHINPPLVKFNRAGGYFNLKDGHHRSTFLYCQGKRRIKVKMSNEDYIYWMNIEKLSEVDKSFHRHQRSLIYTPILHPSYFHLKSERDQTYPTRLDVIMDFLGSRSLRGTKVIDIGCNIGYYARHFAREGAHVTGLEPMDEHYDLALRLNRLEKVNFNLLPDRFESSSRLQRYEIGLLLTVFYHLMGDRVIRNAFLRKINQCVTDMLFWESGGEPETEKSLLLQNTHFTRYVKLAATSGTGKVRELGVFLKT